MTKMVGIKFNRYGKVYNFDCGELILEAGTDVIVETEQGLEFGTTASPSCELYGGEPLEKPLKKVIRLTEEKDYDRLKENEANEAAAYEYCVHCAREMKIDMRPFMVKSTFDSNKLTFFFTAEGRIDFRDIVKKLAKKFESKIEMRQVGDRNQAKMLGGIGRCGNEICCCIYMKKFMPVSIKMAKQQGISLNPSKTSGLCGRLMCCLNFEHYTYEMIGKDFPSIGTGVEIKQGKGRIVAHNVICNKVTVKTEDNQIIDTGLHNIIISDEKKEGK